MRLLTILLLFFSFSSLAQQDTLSFSYAPSATAIDKQQETALINFVKDRQVYKLNIQAYIGSSSSVSKNRVLVERRLISLKTVCATQGIPLSKISINYKVIQEEALFNKMILGFVFIPNRNTNVVYKTRRVEISEIKKFAAPSKPAKVNLVATISTPTKNKKKQSVKKPSKSQKDSLVSAKPRFEDEKKEEPKKKPKKKSYGPLNIKDFKKGAQVVIPKLLFYATRHRLEQASMPSLRALLEIMRDRPSMVIQLQGHICCKKNGDDGMDFDTNTGNLSENRARVVHDYLILNGISPKRLSYVGYGSKYKLVDDGGSAIRGKENRRVEVFVVSE